MLYDFYEMKKLLLFLGLIIYLPVLSQDSPTEFTWDFSENKNIIYSINMITESEMIWDKDDEPKLAQLKMEGLLKIRSKGNNSADLILSDLSSKIITDEDTIKGSEKPTVIQNMSPNGRFSVMTNHPTFKVFFVLPEKEIRL